MGMWIFNECLSKWSTNATMGADLDDLIGQAAASNRYEAFDVNDPSLLPTGDMPARIGRLLTSSGLSDPTRPEVVRSIFESLAIAYANTLDELEQLTGTAIDSVHLVGGASQNYLLCQLVANRSGRIVKAGPVEATATGNVLMQGRATQLLPDSLSQARDRVRSTHMPDIYQPQATPRTQPSTRR